MLEIAGSLYLLSTAAFALVALVVGIRLLILWRRTKELAECLLGAGLVLTAAVGYGVMIAAMVGRSLTPDPENAPAIYTAATTFGWVAHNLGVVCMMGFIVHVFRPGVAWARAAAAIGTLVLWVGWALFVAEGGMRGGVPRGGYWIAFTVIGSYPLWTAAESFHYYARMKRRMALGLANGLVTNRFLLWGIASLSAAASIWTVNVPSFLGLTAQSPGIAGVQAASMLATSLFGIATVSTYWLTFFPPRWYRARFEAPAAR